MAPTYANRTDFEAYVEGWVTDNSSALDRLLERAERQIDQYVGPYGIQANGLKFGAPKTTNELGLSDGQVEALKRATCAQAEYRWYMGDEFFARDQHSSTSGPDFSTTGSLSRIGPKAREELLGSGLIVTGARAI
jgi:hypothetical protein